MADTLPLRRFLRQAVNGGELQRGGWGWGDVKNDMPWKISCSQGNLSPQSGGAGGSV